MQAANSDFFVQAQINVFFVRLSYTPAPPPYVDKRVHFRDPPPPYWLCGLCMPPKTSSNYYPVSLPNRMLEGRFS